MIQFHDVDFSQTIEEPVPIIVVLDSNWMKRAIQNYLENALKYASEGGSIHLHVFVDEPLLHIEVTDQGVGIQPHLQPHLFRRFHRLDENAAQSGSGLGLAIVKSVAEQHQGQVYVNSEIGVGSTFGMSIPLRS